MTTLIEQIHNDLRAAKISKTTSNELLLFTHQLMEKHSVGPNVAAPYNEYVYGRVYLPFKIRLAKEEEAYKTETTESERFIDALLRPVAPRFDVEYVCAQISLLSSRLIHGVIPLSDREKTIKEIDRLNKELSDWSNRRRAKKAVSVEREKAITKEMIAKRESFLRHADKLHTAILKRQENGL